MKHLFYSNCGCKKRESKELDRLVSNIFAVKVCESSGHLTGDGNEFPSVSEGSCLPPLADQVGLEVPVGTVLHEDHDGRAIHTRSQQRQDIWVLEETARNIKK